MSIRFIASVVTLLLGIAAWGGVFYLAGKVNEARALAGIARDKAQQAEQKHVGASVMREIVRATRADREMLDALLSTDIVRFADLIDDTARSSGIPLSIASANPDQSEPPFTGAIVTLRSSGSFQNMLRAAILIETLPAPTGLDFFDLRRGEDSRGRASWDLTARVHFIAKSAEPQVQ